MALTAVDICNRALQEIGEDPIDSLDASGTKEEKACERIYTKIRDELLESYEWHFARRRFTSEQNTNNRHTLLQTAGGWTLSTGGGTAEYYLPLTNTKSFKSKPDSVYEDDTEMTEGTVGSLAAGTWGWGDEDSLGDATIYVRLSDDTDPDSKFAADEDYLEGEYDQPTFEWTYALPIPADTLRVLRTDNFNNPNIIVTTARIEPAGIIDSPNLTEPQWIIEDYRFLYQANEANIQYIVQVTDPAKFDTWYVKAFVKLLGSELSIPLAESKTMKDDKLAEFFLVLEKAYQYNAFEKNKRYEKTLTDMRPKTSWSARGR